MDGGLLARFGEASTDQFDEARLEDGAEAGLAASAPKGAAKQKHTASKAMAALSQGATLKFRGTDRLRLSLCLPG